MTTTNLIINGVEYAPVATPSNIRIVVLQRGWVLVGHYAEEGDEIQLTNAAVIRTWGTTKGLGELVDGPTPNTVLDRCSGAVRSHRLSVVLTIDVEAESWKMLTI